jgi:hypothetical protein
MKWGVALAIVAVKSESLAPIRNPIESSLTLMQQKIISSVYDIRKIYQKPSCLLVSFALESDLSWPARARG